MTEKAAFILSFDCEGKWGLADMITNHHNQHFTNDRLTDTYRRLLEILARYEFSATFAFVGAFTLSPSEYHHCGELFHELPVNGKNWYDRFLSDARKQCFEGWLCPDALQCVQSAEVHEIAAHGFSHAPATEICRKAFRQELLALRQIEQLKNLQLQTYIYPRNSIAYCNELAASGYLGYRGDLRDEPRWLAGAGGLRHLLDETNVSEHSQQQRTLDGPLLRIPPGYFLNWRNGFRRRIPMSVTIRRWKSALRHACRRQGIVHLWSHPHNFIDGDRQLELLDRILEAVALARDAGKLVVRTQAAYCKTKWEQYPLVKAA